VRTSRPARRAARRTCGTINPKGVSDCADGFEVGSRCTRLDCRGFRHDRGRRFAHPGRRSSSHGFRRTRLGHYLGHGMHAARGPHPLTLAPCRFGRAEPGALPHALQRPGNAGFRCSLPRSDTHRGDHESSRERHVVRTHRRGCRHPRRASLRGGRVLGTQLNRSPVLRASSCCSRPSRASRRRGPSDRPGSRNPSSRDRKDHLPHEISRSARGCRRHLALLLAPFHSAAPGSSLIFSSRWLCRAHSS